MIRGPNGVPRLTDVGPLVKDAKDLDRGEIWIETKREQNRRIKSEFLEYGSLSDDFHDTSGEPIGEIVKVSMKYKEWDTILGDTDFFTYTGASVSYAITDVGYIHKIKVNRDLRRLGIGTELIEIVLDDMKQNNIGVVYTQTISDAGRGLMDQFGFEEHDELNTLNPQNNWKFKEL